ncbi:polygalacturonase QRT3-like [Tripterygium wilfordii]|uniref:polygalacturonase QRT3-like n=1 Tax=Tripterygium wilfordii TaxID=458696 RepID=UPI0018F808EC|nr:polygalacturonase QRT3-like [Tripterygium wilfordii]
MEEEEMLKENMAKNHPLLCMIVGLGSLITIHVYGENSQEGPSLDGHYSEQMQKMQALKASFMRPSISLSPNFAPPSLQAPSSTRLYRVTSYRADPTGKTDSTEALMKAIAAAFGGPTEGFLMEGINNLGGAQINLEGGNYMITKPLRMPKIGVGNFVIYGGTIRASDDFPKNGYLIDLSASSAGQNEETKASSDTDENLSSFQSPYHYEYVTFRDLMLDCNHRGGGISVIKSLRTSIDNCYIVHFSSNGILVQGGHETSIRNSFIGQHITVGKDPGEKHFSGTGINLMGNDNGVTDVVIFSADIGIQISGQANSLSGVHCYNKATGFGGTGIYLKVPRVTQTRIVDCYMDYTGIVVEDPVQLHISSSFFLGNAFIKLKSIKGVASGVNIVDNMFSGDNGGTDIVQLDESIATFEHIDQVVVDRNNVREMKMKSTLARGSLHANGNSWTIDFSPVLLFPNLIKHVQYTFSTTGSGLFPNHALRSVSENRVVIESDVEVPATVFVTVDQGVWQLASR